MKIEKPNILEEELEKLSLQEALDRAISAQMQIMKAKLELELLVKTHYYDLNDNWMMINRNDPNYKNKHLLQQIGDFAALNIDLLNK